MVIAAFQYREDFPPVQRLHLPAQHAGHFPEPLGRYVHIGQGIVRVGVEAGGDDQQIRPVVMHGRNHLLLQHPDINLISCAGFQGDVQGIPPSDPPAALIRRADAGIEGPLVNAAKEDLAHLVKAVMSAVALVYVPVENKNPLQRIAVDGIAGGDGDIVEEAESHRLGIFGMVPRWAHRAENALHLSGHQVVHPGQAGARGMEGCLVRVFGHQGIPAVENCRSFLAGAAHVTDIMKVVIGLDPLQLRRRRCLDLQLAPHPLILKKLNDDS